MLRALAGVCCVILASSGCTRHAREQSGLCAPPREVAADDAGGQASDPAAVADALVAGHPIADGDPIARVLPVDAIPAIDAPVYVTASKAGFMRDNEPVLGVVHNGIAKAFSLWHLDRHEIVNDDFDGAPVAVTW
jgi:hypothetical protein